MATNSSIHQIILGALQRKHLYAGTVPVDEVARRRAKNRQARKSRRINRGTR